MAQEDKVEIFLLMVTVDQVAAVSLLNRVREETVTVNNW